MSIRIQAGSLSDFFESARETARQIDRGEKLTRKKTLWVEPSDLLRLLNPRRSSLVRYLRGKKRVMLDDLVTDTNRTAKSLNSDLSILSEYELVRISDEEDAENKEFRKVTEPTFGNQLIELKAEI